MCFLFLCELKHGEVTHACFYNVELSLRISLEELFHSLLTVVIKFFKKACKKTWQERLINNRVKRLKVNLLLLVEKLVEKVFL